MILNNFTTCVILSNPVTIIYYYRLLTKSCPVLEALQKYFKFECTVGLNGRVLVCGQSTSHTVIVRNCIVASEYMDRASVVKMVDKAALWLK